MNQLNRVRDEKQPASSLPLCVLVAEDNEFNSQLLEQLLGRRGHKVQLAKNGAKHSPP